MDGKNDCRVTPDGAVTPCPYMCRFPADTSEQDRSAYDPCRHPGVHPVAGTRESAAGPVRWTRLATVMWFSDRADAGRDPARRDPLEQPEHGEGGQRGPGTTVQQMWRAFGFQPHCSETFKLSPARC